VRVHRQLAQIKVLFHRIEPRVAATHPALSAPLGDLVQKLDALENDFGSLKERSRYLQDELATKMAAITNRRLFTLSILTACLLPPTLVTGFFGMNTKDLPFQSIDGGTWYALRPPPGDAVAEAVLAGHLRGLMAPQSIDVASSDRHTVKPWFNGRVPQSPRVIDLAAEGYPLVGGRIDVVGRSGVPTLVYRHREHVISLTAIAGASRDQAIATQPTIKGYNVVGWAVDGISYWAVSDLGSGDLNRFAQLFRDAPPDQ